MDVKDRVLVTRQACREYSTTYPGYDGWIDDPKDADVIWLLATGKSATSTVTNLLNLSNDVLAFHEVAPRLWHLEDQVFKTGCREGWETLLWACKRDVISVVNGLGMTYAEMNHRLSAFAPAVERMTQGRARYLFLIRSMNEQVVSAYKWGFYITKGGNNLGRLSNPEITDRGQHLAWAWCAQNTFFLDVLEQIPKERRFCLPFENIKNSNIEKIESMYPFFDLEVPEREDIKEALSFQTNKNPNEHIKVEKTWGAFEEKADEIYERAMGVAKP